MTAKPQHTPGPWRTSNGQGQYHTSVLCNGWRSSRDKVVICSISPAPRTPAAWEEAEANARLIASAPDLLDALKQALEQLQAYRAMLAGHQSVVRKARIAIAKAERRR